MTVIEAHWATHVGLKRTNNEDAIGAFEPRNARERRAQGWLYVVADGLGGFEFGERASQYAVQTLLNAYPDLPHLSPDERLKTLIQKINAEIYAMSQRDLQEGQRMATTIVAAVIHQGQLYVAHVGDSRAYLIRGKNVYRLTADHSVIGELIRAGKLTEEDARGSRLKNRLTRSVGSRPQIEVELAQPISLQPDDLIVLCSDGLTQYASDKDLLTAAYGQPREIVERLIAFANQKGGSDNISVCAIRVGTSLPLPVSLPIALPGWAVKALLTGIAATVLIAGVAGGLLLSSLLSGQNTPTPTLTHTLSPTATVFPRHTLTPTLTHTLPPTATVSPTHTFTPTLTPSITPALTLTPTLVFSPTIEPTLTPEASPSPVALTTPTLSSPAFITCIYTVKNKDTVFAIARKFGIPPESITRQDGSQSNMSRINIGEKLLLHGVLAETCTRLGGEVASSSPAP